MADGQNPWDGIDESKVRVLDAAPQQAPAAGGNPWDGIDESTVRVLDAPPPEIQGIAGNVANATEEALSQNNVDIHDSESWTGWAARAGRAATFNLTDYATAARLKWVDGLDADYGDIVKELRRDYEADPSSSAEIVGTLLPAGAAAKAAALTGRGVAAAATRSGMVDGALAWAARNPRLARVFMTSAAGAGAGGAFEAVREATDQVIGASVGEGFSGADIEDAAIQGSIMGAVMGPIADAAVGGAGRIVGWVKSAFGGSDAQTAAASRRILSALAREGEDANAVVDRIGQDAQRFMELNGRAPALAEIISPEQVESLTSVVRRFSGMSERAGELADDIVAKATQSLDDAIRSGKPLKDTLTLNSMAEKIFTRVTGRHGNTMVEVPPDVMDSLLQNKGWVNSRTPFNEGARRIHRVLDARSSLDDIRSQLDHLTAKTEVSAVRQDVAEIGLKIQRLIQDAEAAKPAGASEINALKRLMALRSAMGRYQAALEDSRMAVIGEGKMEALYNAARADLAAFERDGLKITLSDANGLRRAASERAFKLSNIDPDAADVARAVRDAMTKVGVAEVPSYGQAVQLYARAMARRDAQDVGRAAMNRGAGASTENIGVAMREGRDLTGSRISGRLSLPSVQRGMGEGARLDLSRGTRQGAGTTLTTAQKLGGAAETQANLRTVSPREAERIIASGAQTEKSIRGAARLAGPKSPSQLAEEMTQAKDLLEGLFVSHLGGAAKASLLARQMMANLSIPRGVATKLVEMLGDPKQAEKALRYVQSRDIDLPMFMTMVSAVMQKESQ